MIQTIAEDPFVDPRHELVGGDAARMGPWQRELLIRLGLDPQDMVLDLGCGTLRGGLHLIHFLDASRYTGVDPHPHLLAIGRELVTRAALDDREPTLVELATLDALGRTYDWVLTQSVLNHLDEDQIVATISRVSRVLGPNGRWVSTALFDPAAARVRLGEAHGHRPREFWWSRVNPVWFTGVMNAHGLMWHAVADAEHPRGMAVFVATWSVDAHPPLKLAADGTGSGASHHNRSAQPVSIHRVAPFGVPSR
ncbi:MAG: class I SAM-dependent methyltransferase [Deltaproteobacteria bacterium]|nr:class I SAM-dependent methyltransferase [Myxococcales bacterium]MDP3214650.1 class I SAM-dependent methyltransferase [Deltaproteobacteria bacterium]